MAAGGLSPQCASSNHGECPGYYLTAHICECGCHKKTAAQAVAAAICSQPPTLVEPPGPADLLAKLHADTRIPPANLVGKLVKTYTDRRGIERSLELDYLGHAAVTDILLAHDPCWSWEPAAVDETGRPTVDRDKEGWARGLWIRLTIHGHTRLGYGTCGPGKPDAIKELIGDALRNAAMRFGIGLSLWAKEEWEEEGLKVDGPQAGNEAAAPPMTPGHLLAEAAARAGFKPGRDDDQAARKEMDAARRDVLQAAIGKRSTKGLKAAEVKTALAAFEAIAAGTTVLAYELDGTPALQTMAAT